MESNPYSNDEYLEHNFSKYFASVTIADLSRACIVTSMQNTEAAVGGVL